jgi:hypothetical protein
MLASFGRFGDIGSASASVPGNGHSIYSASRVCAQQTLTGICCHHSRSAPYHH